MYTRGQFLTQLPLLGSESLAQSGKIRFLLLIGIRAINSEDKDQDRSKVPT